MEKDSTSYWSERGELSILKLILAVGCAPCLTLSKSDSQVFFLCVCVSVSVTVTWEYYVHISLGLA